jgi:hypothetical protein
MEEIVPKPMDDDEDELEMPESDAPLKPIIDWYNIARRRVKAPSVEIEAHLLGISMPRLRNIIDVNQFDDAQIELLDKHGIDLNIAAAISQQREHWDEILTDDYLQELMKSPHRLTDLYLTKKGESVDTEDMMHVFRKEGLCAKVYQLRVKKLGKPKKGFEKMLQSILSKIAQGKEPSPKQSNVVFQAINQERDSGNFNWASASLKQNCPKSVELIEKWDGN